MYGLGVYGMGDSIYTSFRDVIVRKWGDMTLQDILQERG